MCKDTEGDRAGLTLCGESISEISREEMHPKHIILVFIASFSVGNKYV